MDDKQCNERVRDRDSRWPRYHQCSRNGKVQRDGKWYCKQHDPVAVKKRNDEQSAKQDKEWAEKQETWRRDKAMKQVCEGVPANELESLGPGGLAMLLKEANNG